MKFPNPLNKALIIENHNNLIAEIKTQDGRVFPALIPDTDKTKTIYPQGTEVWVAEKDKDHTRRKIKHEIIIINKGDGMIMTNPKFMKELFLEAYRSGKLTDFSDYTMIKELEETETNHISFELSNKKTKCYVHVAYLYNKEGAHIVFPSFMDFREMTVYHELQKKRKEGYATHIFFLIPRTNILGVKFSWSLDPVAAAQTYEEAKHGLNFICYGCNLDKNEIELSDKIDIKY